MSHKVQGMGAGVMEPSLTTSGRKRVSARRRPEGSAPTWRRVYNDLRAQITSLELRPGELINEKEIAERYEVSRTPVREATLRLADEGLIEVFPQSGTFVARIPFEELPEAMVIRKALEEKSAYLAAERATRSALMTLSSIVERQREAQAAGDMNAFHAADEAFHAEVAQISGFPGLWRLVLQVKPQVDRYRRTTLGRPNRMSEVIADHEAILAQIAGANPNGAAAAMLAHLDAVLPDVGADLSRTG